MDIEGKYLEARRALLDDYLFSLLSEKEAKAKGLSAEDLVKKEVEGKIKKITQQDIQAFYTDIASKRKKAGRSTPPLEKVADQVRKQLEGESSGKRKESYFGELRKKYGVTYVVSSPAFSAPRYQLGIGDLPAKGDSQAPVTIIEFSDYECPYCSKGADVIAKVAKEYKGLVKIYFRDFPLSFHKNAKKASVAARCAADQGKFWPFHDLLFKNQKRLQEDQLVSYAKELKLDAKKFETCMASPETLARLKWT